MGEIIPFPTSKIAFPVSETYFRILGSYEHHVPKDFFWSDVRN